VETSRLRRPLRWELAHSVEHPSGASSCSARFSMRCAAPLPAWLTLGLLRHAARLIWLKQNYKSVLEPQPTARLPPAAHGEPSPPPWDRSPAWCRCHRRSRPHFTASYAQDYGLHHGRWDSARRLSLRVSSLWEPKCALGECSRPARSIAPPAPPSPSTHAPRQPAVRPASTRNKTSL